MTEQEEIRYLLLGWGLQTFGGLILLIILFTTGDFKTIPSFVIWLTMFSIILAALGFAIASSAGRHLMDDIIDATFKEIGDADDNKN